VTAHGRFQITPVVDRPLEITLQIDLIRIDPVLQNRTLPMGMGGERPIVHARLLLE
jgi:hypothetical protein